MDLPVARPGASCRVSRATARALRGTARAGMARAPPWSAWGASSRSFARAPHPVRRGFGAAAEPLNAFSASFLHELERTPVQLDARAPVLRAGRAGDRRAAEAVERRAPESPWWLRVQVGARTRARAPAGRHHRTAR